MEKGKAYVSTATKGSEQGTIDLIGTCPCCTNTHTGIKLYAGENGGHFIYCPDSVDNDVIYIRIY